MERIEIRQPIPFRIILLIGLISIIIIFSLIPESSANMPEVTMDNLTSFLSNDTTDQRVFNPGPTNWYKCGHFTSDLAANASDHNINLGTAILESDFDIDYHVMNYVYIEGVLLFIEPQSDKIYPCTDISNHGFSTAMLIPWRTLPITWVQGYEADVILTQY